MIDKVRRSDIANKACVIFLGTKQGKPATAKLCLDRGWITEDGALTYKGWWAWEMGLETITRGVEPVPEEHKHMLKIETWKLPGAPKTLVDYYRKKGRN